MSAAKGSLAVLVALLVAGGCSSSDGNSIVSEAPSSINGLAIDTGDTAYLGITQLLAKSGHGSVRLISATAVSDSDSSGNVQVLSVSAYDPSQDGLIGALDEEALTAGAYELRPLEGVALAADSAKAVPLVLEVQGVQPGSWRMDYLDVRYEEDGDEHKQRLMAGAALCISSPSCDPGSPPWLK